VEFPQNTKKQKYHMIQPILLLEIYLKESKAANNRDACIPVFIMALPQSPVIESALQQMNG
jgi:hypothetical protein